MDKYNKFSCFDKIDIADDKIEPLTTVSVVGVAMEGVRTLVWEKRERRRNEPQAHPPHIPLPRPSPNVDRGSGYEASHSPVLVCRMTHSPGSQNVLH